MKMFNDLAKKVSDHHSMPKHPKLALGEPEASSEPAAEANEGSIEDMHSDLAEKICPDCHTTVKATMAKHGLGSGKEAAPGLASKPSVGLK